MTTIRIKLPEIKDVEFNVFSLAEDIPVEGNASAIDPKTDKKIANEIYKQLENGNEWAWCTVKVECNYRGFTGTAYLGACSYKNHKDFIANSGYYEDMKDKAYQELIRIIKSLKS